MLEYHSARLGLLLEVRCPVTYYTRHSLYPGAACVVHTLQQESVQKNLTQVVECHFNNDGICEYGGDIDRGYNDDDWLDVNGGHYSMI